MILTFIKLPFAIKTFVLLIFEWPLKTGFTEYCFCLRVRLGSKVSYNKTTFETRNLIWVLITLVNSKGSACSCSQRIEVDEYAYGSAR